MNIFKHFFCIFKQGRFLVTTDVMESRITGKNRLLTLKTCEHCGYVFVSLSKGEKEVKMDGN